MTFIEFDETQGDQVPDEEYYPRELQPEEERLSQDAYHILDRYWEERRQATIQTDIDNINSGREYFHGNLQASINRLFGRMADLTMAIACSQNREYLIDALENEIAECESYYFNHIPLFSNIISMARNLSNSQRQSGWVDRYN